MSRKSFTDGQAEGKSRRPGKWLTSIVLAALLTLAAQAGVDVHTGPHQVLVQAAAGRTTTDLLLSARPLPVFATDAALILKAAGGAERALPLPAGQLFALRGPNGARGILRQFPDKTTVGWLQTADGFSRLDGKTAQSLQGKTITADGKRPAFECTQSALSPPEQAFLRRAADNVSSSLRQEAKAGSATYRARLAIETDNEFLAKFSDIAEATAYVQSLIGFISVVYEDDIDTELQVSYLRLWEAPDPYEQASSTNCMLYEAGRYWNRNEAAIERTTMHFLSGKSNNAGVAWIGVLCGEAFTVNIGAACPGLTPEVDQYGGAYGVTGGIDGDFDGNNGIIWDVIGTAHEIGHNFNSPHTHCYNGIGGNAEPIDQCYGGQAGEGCYAGAGSLPGPAGQGSGTIMSYCHFLGGGLSNIALNFGLNHTYGVAPEREAVRMAAHVAERAAVYLGCLIPLPPEVFENGFE